MGQACDAGLGDCAVAGAWVCDGKDALKCSGTPKAAAKEACGGGDEDCDGKVDESSLADAATGATTWYADCDGDGYAAGAAQVVSSCKTLGPDATGCASGEPTWTTTAPSAKSDCADSDARAFPGQTAFFATGVTGKAASFDFDCDGQASPNFDVPGLVKATSANCMGRDLGWILTVAPDECFDYQTGYSAACGRSATVFQNGYPSGVGRIACGDTGTVCDYTYNVLVECR